MVAWNGHVSNDVGIVWCMVEENEPGYRPMEGKGAFAAPWYLALFENHMDEDGKIDYTAANKAAEKVADQWNREQGFSKTDVSMIVASSMRKSF